MASKHESRARHTGNRQEQPPKERFKKSFAVAALVGVTASAALGAFAKEYYLDYGDITVNAREDGNYVSYTDKDAAFHEEERNEDGQIIVTQESEDAVKNTLTIETEEDTTVEVTIRDVEIMATDRIDPSKGSNYQNHESAISIKGDGDVVLELDGENEVKGGSHHAGVEKNDSDGTGTLTIQDKDHNGSLTATGGHNSAGIGGANGKDSSGLVIAGGTIHATGDYYGAGIGGGEGGDGTVKITGGDVTAIGGGTGAGIGGGGNGNGTVEIIDGTVTVEKAFEDDDYFDDGSGIGGGEFGDADVTIRGGNVSVTVRGHDNFSSGIGGGNGSSESKVLITGGTVTVDKSGSCGGAGIGGGACSTVTITGGTVKATGGNDGGGAGIGGN